MDFWFRYLAVAVLGSALIYLGAPALRPLLARAPAVTTAAMRIEPRLEARTEPASPAFTAPPASQEAATPEQLQTPSPEIAPPPVAPARTAQPPQDLHVVTAPGFTPSTEKLPASGDGVEFWGITVAECDVRGAGGNSLERKVPAGQVVEQIGTVSAAAGERALCRVAQNGGWSEPLLIALSDLFRVPGTRAGVPAETVELLQRYYQLRAQLETRRQSQQQAAASANPHFEAYRRAYRDFSAFTERVKSLTVKRDAASGDKRMQYADELRAMMPEGNRLEKSFHAVQVQYRSWKAKSGTPAAPAAADPELQRLERELAAIQPQVAALGVR